MELLTFLDLRRANVRRLPDFTNAKGLIAHPNGSVLDWELSQWSNAMTGEVGEACNIIKKIERGDFHLKEARPALADELADVAIYLDLLALRAGITLDAAIIHKFNEKSVEVDSEVRLSPAAWRAAKSALGAS